MSDRPAAGETARPPYLAADLARMAAILELAAPDWFVDGIERASIERLMDQAEWLTRAADKLRARQEDGAGT